MKINRNSIKLVKIMLLLFGIAGIFAMGTNTTAAANTSVYVNTHGNNSWDGLNAKWNGTSGPKATITNATGTVTSGGTVYVASGTYKENKININKNMSIIGSNQINTIIYGTNTGPIFNILSGSKVNILNLTLTNGTATNGGAISNNGILTVKSSTFTNNKAGMGGAIYNIGILTVSSCTFTGNSATYGGAIYNDHILNIMGCNFIKNTASNCGGSIYNYYTSNNSGTLTVTGTKFTSNKAIYGGAIGAISHFGTIAITTSIFTGNSATWGGAIYNEVPMSIKNSTLNGNIAAKCGGALYNEGTASVNYNQIIKNTASQGSAIFNDLGTSNLALNWWGSNNNPIKNIYGTTIHSWLILTVKANPKTILNSGKSSITADLLHDNLGNLKTGYVPNGIIVTFTSTLGTIISKSNIINGIAKSTFKTGSQAGTSIITAKADDQTVKATITIKDTVPPKVSSTSPSNLSVNVSRTSTIVVKFNENIKSSSYYGNIRVKNLSTGQYVTITKIINGNLLYIKSSTRKANNLYQVVIPKGAIRDLAGNNLQANYVFKFKTRT
jgi:predicted outer membrane repeat protein